MGNDQELVKLAIFACSVGVLLGALLIVGTKTRWTFLVDPPEEWAPLYSHSVLKRMFGKEFLPGFNYAVGIALIVVGTIGIYLAYVGRVVYGR